MSPEELAAEVQRLGEYPAVRVLPDGSVAALERLLTTTAVLLGCDLWGWERRFCFTDPATAREQFDKLQSEEDELTGWVARRPDVHE